jgi:hypothetical protein
LSHSAGSINIREADGTKFKKSATKSGHGEWFAAAAV